MKRLDIALAKVTVIRLRGPLTIETIRDLMIVIKGQGTAYVVLNLADVTAVDDTAIAELRCANMHGGMNIILANATDEVKRRRDACEISEMLPDFIDVCEFPVKFK